MNSRIATPLDTYSDVIAAKLRRAYYTEIPEAVTGRVRGPAGGRAGDGRPVFKVMVEDRGDNGLPMLQGQVEQPHRQGQPRARSGRFVLPLPGQYAPNTTIDIDRTKCKTLGIPLSNVFDTLQVYMGGYYVNDFNRFGRTWQVNLQAEKQFRDLGRQDAVAQGAATRTGTPRAADPRLAKVERTSGPG